MIAVRPQCLRRHEGAREIFGLLHLDVLERRLQVFERHGLGLVPLRAPAGIAATHDDHAGHGRDEFAKQFELLGAQLAWHGQSGDVAARPREAADEADFYRIHAAAHDDRNRRRRPSSCERRHIAAAADDQIDLTGHELCRELRKTFSSALRRPIVNGDRASFDVAQVRQARAQCVDSGRAGARRRGRENEQSDPWCPRRLLRLGLGQRAEHPEHHEHSHEPTDHAEPRTPN